MCLKLNANKLTACLRLISRTPESQSVTINEINELFPFLLLLSVKFIYIIYMEIIYI